MSRDKRYKRLLNDKRWDVTKAYVKRRAEGCCERCKREGQAEGRRIGDPDLASEGYVTPGIDCHHKIPVESGKTEEEMERLCYDVNNIELLCVPCHIKTHQEMFSHTKDKVAENKKRGAERRASWLDPNYEANNVDDPTQT